jgi:hypothetical protein
MVPSIFPARHGATHVVVADFSNGVAPTIQDPMEGRGFYYTSTPSDDPLAIEFAAGFCPLVRIDAADYERYLRLKERFSEAYGEAFEREQRIEQLSGYLWENFEQQEYDRAAVDVL